MGNFFQGEYTEVTGAGDYGLIDPSGFSQQAFNQLLNTYNFAQGGMSGTQAGLQQAMGNVTGDAAFNQFMSQTPQLQGLVQGATSDLERNLQEQTSRYTQQAVQDVASEFSGLGALYSGATRDVASQRAMEAATNAATTLGAQQIGLTGQLYGQGFSGTQQAQLANLQAAQGQFNTFASLLGGANSGIGSFGAPQYAGTQYEYDPSTFSDIWGGVTAILPTAAAAAGGGV